MVEASSLALKVCMPHSAVIGGPHRLIAEMRQARTEVFKPLNANRNRYFVEGLKRTILAGNGGRETCWFTQLICPYLGFAEYAVDTGH